MTEIKLIPDEYRTDHLFLLVGANPLPNYVAARQLLKPGGTLYLVHSKSGDTTSAVAERLKMVLTDCIADLATEMVPVDESNWQSVCDGIKKWIPKRGQVGLHYTGGTKVMSTHVYRTLEKANLTPAPIFSYLNARTMAIEIEGKGTGLSNNFSLERWPKCNETDLPPSIVELANLHRANLKDNLPDKTIILPELAYALALACSPANKKDSPKKAAEAWRDWCNDVLKKRARPQRANGTDGGIHLGEVEIKWPSEPRQEAALRTAFGITDPTLRLDLEFARRSTEFTSIGQLCSWLNGFWLEHYVLQCIENIANRNQDIHDYGRNLDTDVASTKNKANNDDDSLAIHDFEIDIAAMRSYRLFAISCTTSVDKARLKLFKAMIRTRQLGGDEARVALIAPVGNSKQSEENIRDLWQAHDVVRVFGPERWPRLERGLEKWFMGK